MCTLAMILHRSRLSFSFNHGRQLRPTRPIENTRWEDGIAGPPRPSVIVVSDIRARHREGIATGRNAMATQRIENVTARNAAIARAAYEAYVTKDRAAIEALIADDFHFTSPLDNRLDRETYFRRCWP